MKIELVTLIKGQDFQLEEIKNEPKCFPAERLDNLLRKEPGLKELHSHLMSALRESSPEKRNQLGRAIRELNPELWYELANLLQWTVRWTWAIPANSMIDKNRDVRDFLREYL